MYNPFIIKNNVLEKYDGHSSDVIIPNGVKVIGKYSFYGNNYIKHVTIPSSVQDIEDYAFFDCVNLTDVDIPESVKIIGSSCFSLCVKLTKIFIPKNVTYIGESAFSSCSNLSSIEVDKENTMYDSRDNCNAIIETSKNNLLFGCKNTVIPNTIQEIGNYSFGACDSLTHIDIPDSVTYIHSCAFLNCTELKSLKLPKNMEFIDYSAFGYNSKLEEIYFPNKNVLTLFIKSHSLEDEQLAKCIHGSKLSWVDDEYSDIINNAIVQEAKKNNFKDVSLNTLEELLKKKYVNNDVDLKEFIIEYINNNFTSEEIEEYHENELLGIYESIKEVHV